MMTMTLLMAGCASGSRNAVSLPESSSLLAAKKSFASGDLYVAKKQTENFLKENPSSFEGQQLMGEILNEEIAQHKEAFEEDGASLEELPKEDRKSQIKTWLERGRSLMDLEEYDEATRAVENVFLYDPQNLEASRLLDQIKQRAWTAGKKEIMDGREIAKAEVDDRASIYKNQAREYIQTQQWGAAKMAVQKILLLNPEDEEGLKLQEQIQSKQHSVSR